MIPGSQWNLINNCCINPDDDDDDDNNDNNENNENNNNNNNDDDDDLYISYIWSQWLKIKLKIFYNYLPIVCLIY